MKSLDETSDVDPLGSNLATGLLNLIMPLTHIRSMSTFHCVFSVVNATPRKIPREPQAVSVRISKAPVKPIECVL